MGVSVKPQKCKFSWASTTTCGEVMISRKSGVWGWFGVRLIVRLVINALITSCRQDLTTHDQLEGTSVLLWRMVSLTLTGQTPTVPSS